MAAAMATAGCGGSIIATNDLTPPPSCDASGNRPLLQGLTPAHPVDYIELREVTFNGTPDETFGTKCKTATNVSTCTSAVAAITSTVGMQTCDNGGPIVMCKNRYLVFTSGDQVGTITTVAELAAFLAPVDTSQEAVTILTLDNHVIECASSDPIGSRPAVGGGFDFVNVEGGGCADTFRVEYHVAVDGTVTEVAREKIASGSGPCPVARRTSGAGESRTAMQGVGGYFARAARLEAASVPAFMRLHDELRALRAPVSLLRRTKRAAKQEASHARTMSRLAKRFGQASHPERRDAPRRPLRDAAAIAIENAAEGCVRETFGAVFACFMAHMSTDANVRGAMTRIAQDELDHAVLARAVSRWLEPHLTPEERRAVCDARRAALHALRVEMSEPASEVVMASAGAPSPSQARALLDAAAATLLEG